MMLKSLLILLTSIVALHALEVNFAPLTKDWPLKDERIPILIAVTADTSSVPKRDPVQVMYVMDISENFAGTPQAEMTKGGQKILSQLRNGDLFGVVIYSEFARTHIPMTVITEDSRQKMMSLLDKIPAETGRNLSRGIERALFEMAPHIGRRNHGIFMIVNSLGRMSSGPDDQQLIDQIKKVADSTSARVYTVAYNDRDKPFNHEVMLRAARETGGRAHFARYDRPQDLDKIFTQIALEVSNQHTLNITLNINPQDKVHLYTFGSDKPAPKILTFKGLARGQTRLFYFEATPRPGTSLDIDIDYSYYEINKTATFEDNTSMNLQLGRSTTSSYVAATTPHLVGYSILYNLAETVERLNRGDKDYRRNFAQNYRNMLVKKVLPIRAEVSTDRMDKTYATLMAIYDAMAGGTTDNDLIVKIALYEFYHADFEYVIGAY